LLRTSATPNLHFCELVNASLAYNGEEQTEVGVQEDEETAGVRCQQHKEKQAQTYRNKLEKGQCLLKCMLLCNCPQIK